MSWKSPRQVWSELTAWDGLIQMTLAVAVGKVVELAIVLSVLGWTWNRAVQFGAWLVALAVFMALVVYWYPLNDVVDDAADQVIDAVDGDDGS